MSNLSLCKMLHRILRIDTNDPGTAPTTVTGQTGVLGEIVNFISDAYEDVQQLQNDWTFRHKQGTFNLSSGTQAYSKATIQGTIADYDVVRPFSNELGQEHVLCYTTATGISDSTKVWFVPYEEWRGVYDLGTRPSGKPQFFTRLPDESLRFDPNPNATFTVILDYRRTLHTMTSDSDATTGTPLIPSHLADIIVWNAVLAYCDTRDDTDKLREKAQANYNRLYRRLCNECLPRYTMMGQ